MDVERALKDLSLKAEKTDGKNELMKSVAADIDGVSTELVIAEYTYKTFLIISQNHKLGTMMTIKKNQVPSASGTDDVYTTKIIFGDSGEELEVAARYLAEALKITKPLNICINLRSYDIETLKACVDIILDLKNQPDQ